MEPVIEVGRSCLRCFEELCVSLGYASAEVATSMPPDEIEREAGRFKIWCGSLMILTKSDLGVIGFITMHKNLTKLLQRLEGTLKQSKEVVSGLRLPFEMLAMSEAPTVDCPDDKSGIDEGSIHEKVESVANGNDEEQPEELKICMEAIKRTVNSLYKISLRASSNIDRLASLQLAQRQLPVGGRTTAPEVEVRDNRDEEYVIRTLKKLRMTTARENDSYSTWADIESKVDRGIERDRYLIDRLVSTIGRRRARLKLQGQDIKEYQETQQMDHGVTHNVEPNVPLTAGQAGPISVFPPAITPSSNIPGIPANIATESTSPIHTVPATLSQDGGEIDLPAAPQVSSGDEKFLCPYCNTVCPIRYSRGQAWKTHILQDLQPFICTYEDCKSGNDLHSSRSAWFEHESSHLKLFKCFNQQ